MYSIVRLEPTLRIPPQAAGDEVKEGFIIALQCLLERFRAWTSPFAFRRDCDSRFTKGVKEELLSCRLVDKMFLWWAKDFHDTSELLSLVFTRKDWISSQKFGEDASERPHVDRHAIGHSQDDFWGPVEARLYVGVNLLVLEAAGSEVYNFDFGLSWVSQQDILRFEIAVNDFVAFQQY